MPRPILDEAQIHPAIRSKVADHQQAIVREVMAAIRDNNVVVVGMGMNPFPKKARRALDEAGLPHRYLEYGNYLNSWRERNALKMWCGWPTFPMVFVKGALIGGATELQRLMEGIEKRTSVYSRLNLTVAINYGGRDELTRAIRALTVDVIEGRLTPDQVTDRMISSRLDTADLPDPDLVIRTSGETRTSNFLPWQTAYAEYEFTSTLWPDFTPAELAAIVARYGNRERRFGAAAV